MPRHFNKESGPVFNRAAVVINALIAVVLEELVDQVTIGGHDFDAVEAGSLRIDRGATVLLYNSYNLRRS